MRFRPGWFCSFVVGGTLTFAALSHAPAAHAAQITEVADAIDGDDPFDANIELNFDFVRQGALITRENTQPPENEPGGAARTVDVRELDYERVRFRLKPRLEIGVFHDLAVFTEWPFTIWDQGGFKYTRDTDETNSTLARDQAPNASPSVDGWGESEGSGTSEAKISGGKFGFPKKKYNDWGFDHKKNGKFASYRQGFDNPTFGLRWSPINNERDDTKPTITLQADYTAPLFQFMDPTNDKVTDPGTPGPVADGAHRFHFSVAMSKRYSVLDPYFLVEYGLPLAAPSGGSLDGYQPRHAGGFRFGSEIIAFEDKDTHQRFALNVAGFATYFSEGRDYSEISDAVKEQTYTDQFIRTGGTVGFFFKALDFLSIGVDFSGSTDTAHLLTVEEFGRDGADANKEIDLEDPQERNPYFNPALDPAGRRLKVEQSALLGVLGNVSLTF